MKNTYTYTARSADQPEKVITFTLHEEYMSVGVGAPLEQVERVVGAMAEDSEERAFPPPMWLRPLGVALAERGVGPFKVRDVHATLDGDMLRVNAWTRVANLRLFPVPLIAAHVDNPDAARAFVNQVRERKAARAHALPVLNALDYWVTWMALATLLLGAFLYWHEETTKES